MSPHHVMVIKQGYRTGRATNKAMHHHPSITRGRTMYQRGMVSLALWSFVSMLQVYSSSGLNMEVLYTQTADMNSNMEQGLLPRLTAVVFLSRWLTNDLLLLYLRRSRKLAGRQLLLHALLLLCCCVIAWDRSSHLLNATDCLLFIFVYYLLFTFSSLDPSLSVTPPTW